MKKFPHTLRVAFPALDTYFSSRRVCHFLMRSLLTKKVSAPSFFCPPPHSILCCIQGHFKFFFTLVQKSSNWSQYTQIIRLSTSGFFTRHYNILGEIRNLSMVLKLFVTYINFLQHSKILHFPNLQRIFIIHYLSDLSKVTELENLQPAVTSSNKRP